MKNIPTLSPADRFNAFLLMLIQAIVAQSGGKLPAPLVAMIEAQFRRMGEDFARLAASVEKGEHLPSRRERRTGLSPNVAEKPALPLRESSGDRGRPARKPAPQTLRIQPPPKTRDGSKPATGPPKKFQPKTSPRLGTPVMLRYHNNLGRPVSKPLSDAPWTQPTSP